MAEKQTYGGSDIKAVVGLGLSGCGPGPVPAGGRSRRRRRRSRRLPAGIGRGPSPLLRLDDGADLCPLGMSFPRLLALGARVDAPVVTQVLSLSSFKVSKF